MRISLVVAVASNGVIGHKGKLPWHIPADILRFQAITWAKPVIMGTNTHKSIGKSLTSRPNIVVSNTETPLYESAIKVPDITAAIARASICMPKVEEIVFIGGSGIYAEALNSDLVDCVYLTRIYKAFRGDTYFPFWEDGNVKLNGIWKVNFEEIAICTPIISNAFKYQFVTYEK